MSAPDLPESHKAVRLHPDLQDPLRRIQVESIPAPTIEHPDDAVVKVRLAGLCGSDLHGYRGHEEIPHAIVTGHEFVGEVVALGSSFAPTAADAGRPPLYATLKVGDTVVAPFTSSCAECHFCRIGFTSRCAHQRLFGSGRLPGAQAQYVRVPKAGGTLLAVPSSSSPDTPSTLSDTSLLLLADILPTGIFAAIQALQHPKVLPVLTGARFPLASLGAVPGGVRAADVLREAPWPIVLEEDRILTLAVVGLGPVGLCAIVSLLDLLSAAGTSFRLAAIDLVPARRVKAQAVYDALPTDARGSGEFVTADPEEAKRVVGEWTSGVGCNVVLEIVGNNPALTLSYALIRPFGAIISAGVHQAPQLPFTGREMYNKNVALEFGRCPVRAVFPLALDLLRRRQDVFGKVGTAESLVERVVPLGEAPEAYVKFEQGEWGKVVLDPWS